MNVGSKKIDWNEIRSKLPLEKTTEAASKRNKLFRDFDPNGNGYLSLAEVDKACRDVLKLDVLFNCKAVIMRAFELARKSGAKKSTLSDDYIEKHEFRSFLAYLRQYLEYYVMFDRIDTGDDKKINYQEFLTAVPEIENMGCKVTDPQSTFKQIDKNGGGEITFDEFCRWAIQVKLDLPDDDNFDDEALATMK